MEAVPGDRIAPDAIRREVAFRSDLQHGLPGHLLPLEEGPAVTHGRVLRRHHRLRGNRFAQRDIVPPGSACPMMEKHQVEARGLRRQNHRPLMIAPVVLARLAEAIVALEHLALRAHRGDACRGAELMGTLTLHLHPRGEEVHRLGIALLRPETGREARASLGVAIDADGAPPGTRHLGIEGHLRAGIPGANAPAFRPAVVVGIQLEAAVDEELARRAVGAGNRFGIEGEAGQVEDGLWIEAVRPVGAERHPPDLVPAHRLARGRHHVQRDLELAPPREVGRESEGVVIRAVSLRVPRVEDQGDHGVGGLRHVRGEAERFEPGPVRRRTLRLRARHALNVVPGERRLPPVGHRRVGGQPRPLIQLERLGTRGCQDQKKRQ